MNVDKLTSLWEEACFTAPRSGKFAHIIFAEKIMEECCGVLCELCKHGRPQQWKSGGWMHFSTAMSLTGQRELFVYCKASEIYSHFS